MTEPEAQPQGVELLPCPFCRSRDVTLSNGYDEDGNWVVLCGQCKSSGTFCVEKAKAIERWNTRADLPRATAADVERDRIIAMADALEYELPNFEQMKGVETLRKKLQAETPRATGETTVETALVELREMFPKTFIRVRSTTEIEYNEYADKASYRERHAYVLIMKHGEFSAQTLADCMAQVRAATRTEGDQG
jgi:Lar family restriction alleviation protein